MCIRRRGCARNDTCVLSSTWLWLRVIRSNRRAPLHTLVHKPPNLHTHAQGLNWPSLRVISSTGEASNPDDSHWLMALTRYLAPIIEYCGGTELGGAYITSTSLQPCCPSTFSTPAIGTQMVLLTSPKQPPHAPGQQNSSSNSSSDGTAFELSPHSFFRSSESAVGEVALVMPSLGASQHLLNKDHSQSYFAGMPCMPYPPQLAAPDLFFAQEAAPSTASASTQRAAGTLTAAAAPPIHPHPLPLRRHGDELQRLPNNYYMALGRTDDTMNLGRWCCVSF